MNRTIASVIVAIVLVLDYTEFAKLNLNDPHVNKDGAFVRRLLYRPAVDTRLTPWRRALTMIPVL